jgi:hypothetical protein
MDWGSFGLGNLLGIFIGGLIAHWLAIHRMKKGSVISAKNKFREIMVGALTRSQTGYNEYQIVQTEFVTHYAEALIFSAYLKKRKRKQFEDDLAKYKKWNDIIGNKTKADVMYGNSDPEYNELDQTNPRDLISKLASYADL